MAFLCSLAQIQLGRAANPNMSAREDKGLAEQLTSVCMTLFSDP